MIDNTVGVDAAFWGTKIYPIRFTWNGRRYEVKRITMKFERKDGGRNYLCFAVDAGTMMAELVLDRTDLQWRLNDQSYM